MRRLLRDEAGFGNPVRHGIAMQALRFATPRNTEPAIMAAMEIAAIQALVRFGYGPGPNEQPADDPRAALKAQLQGPDPGLLSGNFTFLASGQDAVDALRDDNRARKALLAQGLPLKANFKPRTVQLIQQDEAAQTGWAIATPSGFRERLVWFWANHFSASVLQNQCGSLIGPMLREAIRPNITGKFADLVLAVERHPAMLRYLDNDVSVGPDSPAGRRLHRGLNENLGRECMELHTVGLAAFYSQTDVTNMAKILTGWSIAPGNQGSDSTGFKYRPNTHEPGPQMLMGRSFDGGEQAGIDALRFLATYPTTYDLLARKLVTHFVADTPPQAAVSRISGVLRESGGDLGMASAALVDLPQAWIPGQKLKTPFDYVISALRAAPAPAAQKPENISRALSQLGQPVWGAPLPNGWPDAATDWAGSEAMLARTDFAFTYAARFNGAGSDPSAIAEAALGPLLRTDTANAMAQAGSRREALTLFLASPEFQRR